MYTVYILQNEQGRYYIGYTSNVVRRLKQHNTNASNFIKRKGPWKLVYEEKYIDRKSAWQREKQIKNYKGGEAFKKLLHFGRVA